MWAERINNTSTGRRVLQTSNLNYEEILNLESSFGSLSCITNTVFNHANNCIIKQHSYSNSDYSSNLSISFLNNFIMIEVISILQKQLIPYSSYKTIMKNLPIICTSVYGRRRKSVHLDFFSQSASIYRVL